MSEALLLADDSVTMQRVVELTLAREGLQVVSVSDGQQAIDHITTRRPAAALISVNLQKVNGFDVARFVRDHPEYRVPVVLLAGAFDNLDDAQVRASGAVGVLVKPFEPSVVIKRVKELLGMKNDGSPAATEASPDSASGAAVAPAPSSQANEFGTIEQSSRRPEVATSESDARGSLDYREQLNAVFRSIEAQLEKSAAAPQVEFAGTRVSDPLGLIRQAPEEDSVPLIAAPAREDAPATSANDDKVAPASGREASQHADKADGDLPPITRRETTRDSSPWDSESSSHGERDTSAASAPNAPDFAPNAPGAPSAPGAPHAPSAPDFAPSAPGAPSAPSAPDFAPSAPSAPEFAHIAPDFAPIAPGVAPSASRPIAPADAFAMLWAQEQGEALPPQPPPPPLELGEPTINALGAQVSGTVAERVVGPLATRVVDDLALRLTGELGERVSTNLSEPVTAGVADRVADRLSAVLADQIVSNLTLRLGHDLAARLEEQVAERLLDGLASRLSSGLAERVAELVAERTMQGALGDSLRQTVHEVAERVVRAEIERIRAAAAGNTPRA